MTVQILPIEGDVRGYAWGSPGGVSRTLGGEPHCQLEAELWLGAHPSSPSRILGAVESPTDLAAWEEATGTRLPYLLKLLSAASPLSLQAHPTPEQARAGFAAESAAGIPLEARERNYKDPYSKPELIVAIEDGFEALCGFRPVKETLAVVRHLAEAATDAEPFAEWESRLSGSDGVRRAFTWLLDGGPVVDNLISQVTRVAQTHGEHFELPRRIAAEYPGDPGIVVALMLNHVRLADGESLWLPAGNIHAYLRGTGMELMGPSDNVLRGGMTPKHIDVAELSRVLDFTPSEAPRLPPIALSAHTVSYRPASLATGADVPFELLAIKGDEIVTTGGPSIGLAVDGAFTMEAGGAVIDLARGRSVFVTDAATLSVRGRGRLFLAIV